mmetsp:Transcript_30120/g.67520  ORF Transcript_30120/g.67520 Transcript_30120/m.67520 type:complete len:128 (+) Transcript_30120:273-656(+)
MQRKAKREGKALDFYLSAEALRPPSLKQVAQVAALASGNKPAAAGGPPAAEALAAWRQGWPQHCFAHHLGPDGTGRSPGCPRDRTCAFLHADAVADFSATPPGGEHATAKSARFDEAPSWLEENGGS